MQLFLHLLYAWNGVNFVCKCLRKPNLAKHFRQVYKSFRNANFIWILMCMNKGGKSYVDVDVSERNFDFYWLYCLFLFLWQKNDWILYNINNTVCVAFVYGSQLLYAHASIYRAAFVVRIKSFVLYVSCYGYVMTLFFIFFNYNNNIKQLAQHFLDGICMKICSWSRLLSTFVGHSE